MDIVTRKEAIRRGLVRYFTGKPCKHGHCAERNTNDRICHECKVVYEAKPERAEQRKAQQREYHKTPGRQLQQRLKMLSPEYKAWAAEYQASPQGKITKSKYRMSIKGKEAEKAYNDLQKSRDARTTYRLSSEGKAKEKAWRASPEGKAVILANNARRRALHRERVVPLTKEEKKRVDALYAEAVMRSMETGEEHHVDHRLPLSRGGVHHPDNLWIVPMSYNLAKKDLTVEEYETYLLTGARTRQLMV
jgi:hypothetical protein